MWDTGRHRAQLGTQYREKGVSQSLTFIVDDHLSFIPHGGCSDDTEESKQGLEVVKEAQLSALSCP